MPWQERARALTQRIPDPVYSRLRSFYWRRKQVLSQFGQDFWVFGEAFNEKREGYFVEIGAADGITLSNTFILEKRYQWQGLCIEAEPSLFESLRRVRRAISVNVCLDAQNGQADFVSRALFSGIVGETTDNKGHGDDAGAVIRVQTRTFESVLTAQGAPRIIDYLSIDVEGAEDRILCGFPFAKYCFRCLTIERPKPELREVLRRNGYVVIKEIPKFDVFYVHESFLSTYSKNMFDFWSRQRQKT
jgi:FkbM family methyltransferase